MGKGLDQKVEMLFSHTSAFVGFVTNKNMEHVGHKTNMGEELVNYRIIPGRPFSGKFPCSQVWKHQKAKNMLVTRPTWAGVAPACSHRLPARPSLKDAPGFA